jgi:hypothetical protein
MRQARRVCRGIDRVFIRRNPAMAAMASPQKT